MESRASDASVSGSARRAPADDDERIEEYLHRETNRDAARVKSHFGSSSSSPEHPVLVAIPITHALHRLEDMCAMSPSAVSRPRRSNNLGSGTFPPVSLCVACTWEN